MKHAFGKSILILSLAVAFNACQKSETNDDSEGKKYGNFILFDNSSALTQRITVKEQAIDLTGDDGSALKSSVASSYRLKLIAEVAAPQYQGQTLQASHVSIKGSYAIVTYNTKGDKYLGGVEIFDISDEKNPKITWQAIFPNSDVSASDYYKQRLCIVGATNPKADGYKLSSPAFLQTFAMDGYFNIIGSEKIIDLPSYAGTGVNICPKGIFAVSGSTGGLSIFANDPKSANDLTPIYSQDIADARAISVTCSDVYVLQAKPGTIHRFYMEGESPALVYSTKIAENLQDEAKSAIEANQKYVFTALNYEGVKIFNVDGTLKQTIPAPVVPEGRNPENYVSNGVAVNDDLVLVANGEAGVYVGSMNPDKNDKVELLGYMKFEAPESANFVESKENLIFVANGLGGLKILTISKE